MKIIAFAFLFTSLFAIPSYAQTNSVRSYGEIQFGSETGLGYKFPHTAFGLGFEVPVKKVEVDLNATFSPDRKYITNDGRVFSSHDIGILWLHNVGLSGGATWSELHTSQFSKNTINPTAGMVFRFRVSNFSPMRLYVDWLFPTGTYNPQTKIESNRLTGPEIYLEAQAWSHARIGTKFGVYHGLSQGNPLCDGTIGYGGNYNIAPCPRSSFTQGIAVLYLRFTTKANMDSPY